MHGTSFTPAFRLAPCGVALQVVAFPPAFMQALVCPVEAAEERLYIDETLNELGVAVGTSAGAGAGRGGAVGGAGKWRHPLLREQTRGLFPAGSQHPRLIDEAPHSALAVLDILRAALQRSVDRRQQTAVGAPPQQKRTRCLRARTCVCVCVCSFEGTRVSPSRPVFGSVFSIGNTT